MWTMDVVSQRRWILEVCLYIYTAIAPIYGPFQEYSVKKGQFVSLFWTERLERQATLMQAIQRIGIYC